MFFLKYFVDIKLRSVNLSNNLKKPKHSNNDLLDLEPSTIPCNKESASKIVENAEKKESVNNKLMKFKEFKYLYNKTKIPPIYFVYFLVFLFTFMVVGYLENLLTTFVGILYPMYFSIKSLRERNRDKIRNWLKYWIVFSLFLNFEGVFAYFLDDIPLYFFYKVTFLLICFLPHYNGAQYFYENLIKYLFIKYENDVYGISVNLAKRIKSTLLDDIDEEGVSEE